MLPLFPWMLAPASWMAVEIPRCESPPPEGWLPPRLWSVRQSGWVFPGNVQPTLAPGGNVCPSHEGMVAKNRPLKLTMTALTGTRLLTGLFFGNLYMLHLPRRPSKSPILSPGGLG